MTKFDEVFNLPSAKKPKKESADIKQLDNTLQVDEDTFNLTNIVSRDEIRANYETALENIKEVIEIGSDALKAGQEMLETDKSNSLLIERIATLIRAVTEANKTLAGLHKDSGDSVTPIKKLELNKNEFKFDANSISELTEKIKKGMA